MAPYGYTKRIGKVVQEKNIRLIKWKKGQMSKDFLKFCKLISNLMLGQIIVSNLTNVHKLNSRINYAQLH